MTAKIVFDPLDEVQAQEVEALVSALEIVGAGPELNAEKTQGFGGTIALVLSIKLAVLTCGQSPHDRHRFALRASTHQRHFIRFHLEGLL